MPSPSSLIRFSSTAHLRQRLILSTLSQKTLRIQAAAQLHDYEISLLRLVDKLTNGSQIDISHSGSAFSFTPGVLIGGSVTHDCPSSRAIGYFLELAVALAPFCKLPLDLTLTGITNDNVDPSVDTLRTVLLPQLKRYGLDESSGALELKISRRGAPPLGGGCIVFKCPTLRCLKPQRITDPGKIKRIRGIAYATRISPLMASRVVEAARGVLNRYIPDIYIYTDVYKGKESGLSPGYALTLVAESTTGSLISSECAYKPRIPSPLAQDSSAAIAEKKDLNGKTTGMNSTPVGGKQQPQSTPTTSLVEASPAHPDTLLANDYSFPTPEDLGVRAARLLLQEIKCGGAVDTATQWLSVLYSALGPEDVSKVCVGGLSRFTVQLLRDINTFLGVTFNVQPDTESRTVMLTCLGIGYVNVSKRTT